MTSPTPLELLSLAHTRRTDPSLALSMAEQAGKEHDAMNKENADERANANRLGTVQGGGTSGTPGADIASPDAAPFVLELSQVGFGG